jgi:uncharacterized protein
MQAMGDVSNEPSMEDILSSIKKIIAEDSVQGLGPRVRARASKIDDVTDQTSVADQAHDDVLELTVHSEPESVGSEKSAQEDVLLSEKAEADSKSALESLAQLKAAPEPVIVHEAPAGSTSVEDLVREMLRPMLKDWLDANLPEIVRNAVTREVARIAGRQE